MTYNNTYTGTIRTIRSGDRHFQISNGLVTASRAGLEISSDCPYNHLQILQTCIDRGWVKSVAYVTERELMLIGLANE